MAEIFYNTPLDSNTWTQHQIQECAGLTHHAFVRFDSASTNGAPASFLAIYDLDHAPARSKAQPWQGGVTLVRVRPHQENREDFGPSADYLIVAFNRALKQERAAAPKNQSQTLASTQATAGCFVRITDNVPQKADPADRSPSSNQPLTASVSGAIIPLTSTATLMRGQYINFDKDGLILEAGVSIRPK